MGSQLLVYDVAQLLALGMAEEAVEVAEETRRARDQTPGEESPSGGICFPALHLNTRVPFYLQGCEVAGHLQSQ